VPYSCVDNGGKPYLAYSDASNDNDARLLVRIGRFRFILIDAFSPATNLAPGLCKFGLYFEGVGLEGHLGCAASCFSAQVEKNVNTFLSLRYTEPTFVSQKTGFKLQNNSP